MAEGAIDRSQVPWLESELAKAMTGLNKDLLAGNGIVKETLNPRPAPAAPRARPGHQNRRDPPLAHLPRRGPRPFPAPGAGDSTIGRIARRLLLRHC